VSDQIVAELLKEISVSHQRQLALAERLLAKDEAKKEPMPVGQPVLNDLELKVVRAIGRGQVLGKTIAKAVGRSFDDENFRRVLSTLKRFRVLTGDKGQGYTVAPAFLHLLDSDPDSDD
jgi:hypothetical protein